MATHISNSLIGITDREEGTNLSRFLMKHGWNAEHVSSAEELLADLVEGSYGLVVLDEELLNDSQYSLSEYLEEVASQTAVLVLTEPGSPAMEDLLDFPCAVLQHPFSYESLRIAIERMVGEDFGDEDFLDEEDFSYEEEEDDFDYDFDLEGVAF